MAKKTFQLWREKVMFKIRFTALCAVALLAGLVMPASAQEQETSAEQRVAAAPKLLSGRWYTPDRMYSNTMSLATQGNKARVTYYSTRFGCSILDDGGAATITSWDGTVMNLKLNADTECFKDFRISITKISPEKYRGEITLTPLITGGVSSLHIELSPTR